MIIKLSYLGFYSCKMMYETFQVQSSCLNALWHTSYGLCVTCRLSIKHSIGAVRRTPTVYRFSKCGPVEVLGPTLPKLADKHRKYSQSFASFDWTSSRDSDISSLSELIKFSLVHPYCMAVSAYTVTVTGPSWKVRSEPFRGFPVVWCIDRWSMPDPTSWLRQKMCCWIFVTPQPVLHPLLRSGSIRLPKPRSRPHSMQTHLYIRRSMVAEVTPKGGKHISWIYYTNVSVIVE